MESLAEVSYINFKSILTKERIRIIQLIQGILAISVIFFLLVLSILYIQENGNVYSFKAYHIIVIFSIVHLFIGIIVFILAILNTRRQYSLSYLKSMLVKTFYDNEGTAISLTAADRCLLIIRNVILMQTMVQEIPVFIGLGIILFAIITGTIYHYPIIMLNLVTSIYQLVYIIITFPTMRRIESTFKKRILAKGKQR
jgi:hypothetical protein